MRSVAFGTGLPGIALIAALVSPLPITPVFAQSDAVWVSVSQGTELLATVAAKPMGESRREDIVPSLSRDNASQPIVLTGFPSTGLAPVSMNARVVPVAQTSVRVPATPLDRNTPLAISGFVLRYWRSNGTAYVQVASVASVPGVADRESAITTLALVPGESYQLVEAKTLGAAPITISASNEPAPMTSTTALARRH